MSSVALARVYQRSFESHPHYTLAVTNGTLNALGDVVAQSVQLSVRSSPTCSLPASLTSQSLQTNPQGNEYHQSTYDLARTVRFFIFGVGMGAFLLSFTTKPIGLSPDYPRPPDWTVECLP